MYLSPAYVTVLESTLRQLGYDASEFARNYSEPLREKDLYDLCRRAVEISHGHAELPLLVGTGFHLGTHGLFGHALMSCQTLRQAARILVRYNPVNGDKGRVQVVFADASVVVSYFPAFSVPGAPNFLTDLFFSAVSTALRELIGRQLETAQLELAYTPSIPEERYSDIVGIPTTYGHLANRLIGPSDVLDRPLPAAHISTADAYLRQCEKLLRRMEESHGYQSIVRRLLMTSRASLPNAAEIADRLNMSPRTLRRRLLDEGTSYQAIVNEVRSYLACEYLRDTDISVSEIGALLGFEDISNFRNAFKRWTGVSPRDYRRQARQTDGNRR